jgi:hypothetical protein
MLENSQLDWPIANCEYKKDICLMHANCN